MAASSALLPSQPSAPLVKLRNVSWFPFRTIYRARMRHRRQGIARLQVLAASLLVRDYFQIATARRDMGSVLNLKAHHRFLGGSRHSPIVIRGKTHHPDPKSHQ